MREEDEQEYFTKIDNMLPKKINPYLARANKNIILKKKKKEFAHFGDEIIISHLSTKRKDHNIERFEKLFHHFDKVYAEFRNPHN
jgi:hypothetical protein